MNEVEPGSSQRSTSATTAPGTGTNAQARLYTCPKPWSAYRRNSSMKFRKVRPSIAACIGRMIVHSAPKKPAASPEKKTLAASAHSSPVTTTPRLVGVILCPVRCLVEREDRAVRKGEPYGEPPLNSPPTRRRVSIEPLADDRPLEGEVVPGPLRWDVCDAGQQSVQRGYAVRGRPGRLDSVLVDQLAGRLFVHDRMLLLRACSSSRRAMMSSLANTLRRCRSTVRPPMNSCTPIHR